jgi:hypothetical protein
LRRRPRHSRACSIEPPLHSIEHELRVDCRAAERTSEQRQPLLDIAADLAGWNCGLVDEKAKPIVEFEKTEPPMKYY